jgi:hypothetical protein
MARSGCPNYPIAAVMDQTVNEELRARTLKRMAERNIPQGLGPRVCGQLHPEDGETACTLQPGHIGHHQARGADSTVMWLKPIAPPPTSMAFMCVATGASSSINNTAFYQCLTCGACVVEVHGREDAKRLHIEWHAAVTCTSTPDAPCDPRP